MNVKVQHVENECLGHLGAYHAKYWLSAREWQSKYVGEYEVMRAYVCVYLQDNPIFQPYHSIEYSKYYSNTDEMRSFICAHAHTHARTYCTQTNKLTHLQALCQQMLCVIQTHMLLQLNKAMKVDDKDHKSDYIINSHMPKENILGISKAQAKTIDENDK